MHRLPIVVGMLLFKVAIGLSGSKFGLPNEIDDFDAKSDSVPSLAEKIMTKQKEKFLRKHFEGELFNFLLVELRSEDLKPC